MASLNDPFEAFRPRFEAELARLGIREGDGFQLFWEGTPTPQSIEMVLVELSRLPSGIGTRRVLAHFGLDLDDSVG